MARWRCDYHHGVLLLGSATPSIATYMKAMPGVRPVNRLTLIEMTQRVKGRRLPDVEVVDMREELVKGNKTIFSAALIEALGECLNAGHQAILFINRRGYSTFVSCRACGHVEKCNQCDVSMTYHQSDGLLHCHYCGDVRVPPRVCPECGSKFIKYFGTGTQKVEEEVRKLFPDVAVARMDVDTTGAKDAHEKILGDFRSGKTRVLVGTQMIAKGLDFPDVTLVGVVAADLSLHVPDYRSVERTFQLITQVAGRAGRADAPGKVIVQTYDPDHYGIQLAAKQDYRAFYFKEETIRRRGLYPLLRCWRGCSCPRSSRRRRKRRPSSSRRSSIASWTITPHGARTRSRCARSKRRSICSGARRAGRCLSRCTPGRPPTR